MIIGEDFAWGHLGKTGGHTTWELFHLFPQLIVSADGLGHESQHTPFAERRTEIEGKHLALNIRRLPSWMLSYHMHRAQFGDYPDYRPIPMVSPHDMAVSDDADRHLAGFTDDGRLEIDFWLRTEHLLDDFLAFISGYVDLTPKDRARIAGFGRRNVGTYDRRLSHWFSSAHVELMYRSNPVWAAIEEVVYGGRVDGRGLSAELGRESSMSGESPLRTRLAARLRGPR
jgi:hypothetical protein